jgi:DNA-binding CsgD family transcriptional regulator
MDMAYAALHQLLSPAVDLVKSLPQAQARALRSSLGLGRRVEADRLVLGAATVALLSAQAERGPLLLLVDDAQWLDGGSAEALAFAARRLGADDVAMLIAIRSGESSPFLAAGLPQLSIKGLDRDSAIHLLENEAGHPVSSDTAAWLFESTAGNPLALKELGRDAIRLSAPAADVPLPVTTTVERAYLRRAANLSAAQRKVLLLLAAAGTAEPALVRRAALRLGVAGGIGDDIDSATGLIVSRQGQLEFVHPLARAAIYHAASSAERRAAHGVLAAVMTAPDEIDRRTWHLAAATDEPDASVAALLDDLAHRARARSAYAAAAAAFMDAARLTTETETQARRLASAADNAWLAGRSDEASRLLQQADAIVESESTRGQIRGLLGHIRMRQGQGESGYVMLLEAAERVKSVDRLKAITFLGDACISACVLGRPEERLEAARTALGLTVKGDPPEFAALAHAAYGTHAILLATGADGPAHLRQAVELFQQVPPSRMDPLFLLAAGFAGLFLREAKGGGDLVDRALERAREYVPTAALPMLMFSLAREAAATDKWAVAHAYYDEAIEIAAETKQWIWQAMSLAGLAWLEAYEGREDECRRHATLAAEISQPLGMVMLMGWSSVALGQLELGLGHPEAAIAHLRACEVELARASIHDPDLAAAPDLVDAYLRLGRRVEAQRTLEDYVPRAAAKGQPFALARLARAQALLRSEDEMVDAFAEALRLYAKTSDRFEVARTELFFGERLRRARRRREAREQLHAALRTFERLGAEPWANRALAELRATGETASARDERRRLSLTPQELRVALAVAQGRTTREAAAHLYLSPKTIEYHLRNVYDKLEVRSREQLAAALASSAERN